MGFLDFIFPKYCVNCKKFGDYLCSNCFSRLSFDTKNICLKCGKPSYDGLTHPKCLTKSRISGSFTGVVYNGITKKLIHQFKYKPYVKSLAPFLVDLLYESLIQNENFNYVLKLNPVLIPIPLSKKKYKSRGYNQSEILAKGLAKKFNLEMTDGLIRIKETRSQIGLNKEERKENMQNAFDIHPKCSSNFQNRHVLLVDDVLTTGSTFSEATSVLKHNGAREVWAVAFAKED